MKINTKIEIELPELVTISYLEKAIFKAVWQAARELFVMAFKALEEQAFKHHDVAKQRLERKWLLTRFGWIRFSRYKVRFRKDCRYGYLLDNILGIEGEKATTWVKKKACYLCTNYPYRQAASLLSSLLNDNVGFRSLWSQVQKEGKDLRCHLREKRINLFERGKPPPKDEEKREIVVVEADGTFIAEGGRPKGSRMEVKLGVMYSGKKLTSKTAKHKRYELVEKQVFSSLEDSDTFGQNLSIVAEEKLALSSAQNILLVGDGGDWIENMGRSYLKGELTYQLDHFHLKKNIKAVCAGDINLYKKLVSLALGDKIDKLTLLLKTGAIVGRLDKEKIDDLTTYLKNNSHGIWGSRSLEDKVSQKEVLVVGSGVIEKNADTVVSRRFKRRGMRFSREGASNLLALRVLALNDNDWNKWWERQAA